MSRRLIPSPSPLTLSIGPSPVWLLLPALLMIGCGSGRRQSSASVATLDACIAKESTPGEVRLLPACVATAKGVMVTDSEYIAGVVDCELGWFARSPAALMAQAVAARTYLAAFLDRKGEKATVPIGPHFQCWRPTAHARSRQAALATSDTVMYFGREIINGNYVAGARQLNEDCTADIPEKSGYDYASWNTMRRRYMQARERGKRRPFKGVYWTELLITRNEGRSGEAVEGTPFASPGPKNRGALGQYAASCLADSGYDTEKILRYFYGEDVAVSLPLPDAQPPKRVTPQPGAPLEEALPELEIPDLQASELTLPALSYRAE